MQNVIWISGQGLIIKRKKEIFLQVKYHFTGSAITRLFNYSLMKGQLQEPKKLVCITHLLKPNKDLLYITNYSLNSALQYHYKTFAKTFD